MIKLQTSLLQSFHGLHSPQHSTQPAAISYDHSLFLLTIFISDR